MPTVTVKLDKERAARLTRWARRSKLPNDLERWVNEAHGKGLGRAGRES